MADVERRRFLTAHHEGAHAICAALFGFEVEVVSIRPAEHFHGVAIYRRPEVDEISEILGRRLGDSLMADWNAVPVPLFDPEELRNACLSIMVSLAGAAGDALVPHAERTFGYVEDTPEENAVTIARKLTDIQAGLLADAEGGNPGTDSETAYRNATRIAGVEGAGALVAWLGWEARRLVFSELVRELMAPTVAELLAHDAISGQVVVDLIANMPRTPRRGLHLVADTKEEE